MRYCDNDDCPDFAASGVRQEFTDRALICPACGTTLAEGDRPIDETEGPSALGPPAFDSPVPGILGGSATGPICVGESENLCRSCAAPIEPDVRYCENCEALPKAAEAASAEERAAPGVLRRIRDWWKGG